MHAPFVLATERNQADDTVRMLGRDARFAHHWWSWARPLLLALLTGSLLSVGAFACAPPSDRAGGDVAGSTGPERPKPTRTGSAGTFLEVQPGSYEMTVEPVRPSNCGQVCGYLEWKVQVRPTAELYGDDDFYLMVNLGGFSFIDGTTPYAMTPVDDAELVLSRPSSVFMYYENSSMLFPYQWSEYEIVYIDLKRKRFTWIVPANNG